MIFIGVGSADGLMVQSAGCLSDASLEKQRRPQRDNPCFFRIGFGFLPISNEDGRRNGRQGRSVSDLTLVPRALGCKEQRLKCF